MFRTDAIVESWCAVLFAMITAAALGLPAAHAAERQPKAHAAAAKSYATPESAVEELVAAIRAADVPMLHRIFGPAGAPLVSSGDPVADKTALEAFMKEWGEGGRLERRGEDRAILVIGKDAWPFPIPLAKTAEAWRFDARAGREEMLNRRIGRNELSTVKALLAYVDAQQEYYDLMRRSDRLPHFADRFVSSKGRRDGLYWPTKEGEPAAPLGPLFDGEKAAAYLKAAGEKPVPYFGYHYRILKAQGTHASGGAYSYVVQGRMIGGHAVIAWPVSHGNSGVMTFLASHDGVVYERDLGPDTAARAARITAFDPDRQWRPVKEAQ